MSTVSSARTRKRSKKYSTEASSIWRPRRPVTWYWQRCPGPPGSTSRNRNAVRSATRAGSHSSSKAAFHSSAERFSSPSPLSSSNSRFASRGLLKSTEPAKISNSCVQSERTFCRPARRLWPPRQPVVRPPAAVELLRRA